MNKTTEALKRVLAYVEETAQFIPTMLDDEGITVAALLREALAEPVKVDAKAIRAEALEEAEEIAKTIGGSFAEEFLAAIRGLK